jgi:hypothetical protein
MSPFEKSLADLPKAQARVVEPFRKLICSMYTRPYVIKDVVELLELIRLADYYCGTSHNLLLTLGLTYLGTLLIEKFANVSLLQHSPTYRELSAQLYWVAPCSSGVPALTSMNLTSLNLASLCKDWRRSFSLRRNCDIQSSSVSVLSILFPDCTTMNFINLLSQHFMKTRACGFFSTRGNLICGK